LLYEADVELGYSYANSPIFKLSHIWVILFNAFSSMITSMVVVRVHHAKPACLSKHYCNSLILYYISEFSDYSPVNQINYVCLSCVACHTC